MNILIVGLGNMGFSIARALQCPQKQQQSKSHVVCSYDPSSIFSDCARESGITHYDDIDDVQRVYANAGCDVVIFAVKPDFLMQACNNFKSFIHRDTCTVISIVAGVETSVISRVLSDSDEEYAHVMRYMPTIAAQLEKSITAISSGRKATDKDKHRAREIADRFGAVIEISENLMSAFTGVAGSGIAFFAAFIEALTLAGVKEGLSYGDAYSAAREASVGALELLRSSDKATTVPRFSSPSALITAVSSPGGTTIAGIEALHAGGMYAAVMNAVHCASKRSREIEQAIIS